MAIEKEDIVQYVQETPGNSNPAVLRSLLNQLEGSGEGATFKVEKEDDEKSYQSTYTGAEIDAAVANVPVVTTADAGKALVVDENGKIVAGEAGVSLPKIDILQSELGNVYGSIGMYLVSATDKIELSDDFFIQDEGGASIGAKIACIIENGIGFVEFEGFGGQMFIYKVSDTAAAIAPIYFMLPGTSILVNFSAIFTLTYNDDVPAAVTIGITKQKVNYSQE